MVGDAYLRKSRSMVHKLQFCVSSAIEDRMVALSNVTITF